MRLVAGVTPLTVTFPAVAPFISRPAESKRQTCYTQTVYSLPANGHLSRYELTGVDEK